jgi:hypothetical protein
VRIGNLGPNHAIIMSRRISMTDISTIPTPDLVRELCSRKGVVEYDFSSGEFYSLKSGNYREKLLGLLEMKDGPVKIIVVPGGE